MVEGFDPNKQKGYKSTVVINATKDENGFWVVHQTVTQEVSEDGKTWDDRNISVKSIDEDFNLAVGRSVASIAYYLEKVGGNLFIDLPPKEDEIIQ